MRIQSLFQKYGQYVKTFSNKFSQPSSNVSPGKIIRLNTLRLSNTLLVRSYASIKRPVVIGGSNVDIIITAGEKIQLDGRFIQGNIIQCCGGVGRNIADALARLQTNPLYITAISSDDFGNFLLEGIKHIENKGFLKLNNYPSAYACVIIDVDKDCKFIIGYLDIHSQISREWIQKFESDIVNSSFVIIDGNLQVDSVDYVLSVCGSHNIPLWFEPTDVAIADLIFKSNQWNAVTHISPNFNELKRMCSFLTGTDYSKVNPTNIDDIIKTSIDLSKHIKVKVIMVTLGENGLLIITENDVKYFEALKIKEIKNTIGAGDCTVAGYIAAHLHNLNETEKVAAGLSCARQSLMSATPVPLKMELEIPEVNYKIIERSFF